MPKHVKKSAPMQRVKRISERYEFDQEVTVAGSRLVVLYAGVQWCEACKRIKRVFSRMANTFRDVVFLAVDGEERWVKALGVQAYPTFLFFISGSVVDQLEGADKDQLRDKIILHEKQSPGHTTLSLIHI